MSITQKSGILDKHYSKISFSLYMRKTFFTMLYFIRIFWKSFLWAVIILILSGIPGQVVEPYAIWNADKLVHAFIYFGFTLFLLAGFKKKEKETFFYKNFMWIAPIISILYGGLMEVLQATIFINRSGNIPDFLFNSVGAIIAVLSFSFWMKKSFFRRLIG